MRISSKSEVMSSSLNATFKHSAFMMILLHMLVELKSKFRSSVESESRGKTARESERQIKRKRETDKRETNKTERQTKVRDRQK